MHPSVTRLFLPGLTLGVLLAVPAARAQLNPAVTLAPTRMVFLSNATNAGAPANNAVDFQDATFTPANPQSTGFLPTFTKIGFVTFNSNGNYNQEIIEGTNVGQPGNNVYITVAGDKTKPIADVTFAAGIFSLGFDFKDTAGNGTASDVPQNFTFSLLSGATSLGNITLPTISGGTMFTFAGFNSTVRITELIVTSSNNTPNQDVVLDNFAVSSPVPEPGATASVLVGLVGLVAGRRFVRQRRLA